MSAVSERQVGRRAALLDTAPLADVPTLFLRSGPQLHAADSQYMNPPLALRSCGVTLASAQVSVDGEVLTRLGNHV